ncbi:thymidylate synthase [Corticibacter populi]|nr:thymidylate synthase [Corticibacter populi]
MWLARQIDKGGKVFGSHDTLDDMLYDVLKALLAERTSVKASRGDFTELFGVLLHLKNPRARLSRSEDKSKVFSALGELLWYLSRDTKLDFIDYYVPGVFQDESDDQVTVRSGYGERLFSFNGADQMANVIKLLKEKPSSRRAVIQLFDATDLLKPYKSIPCTCTLQFMARDDRLHMFVSMRSNDAFLGLPHDVFSFTMLQELVARSVGMEVGEYKHCAGSLHLYKKHAARAARYLEEGYQSKIAMPPMPMGDPWDNVKQLQAYEQGLRERGAANSQPVWDSYWQELAHLLDAYRAYKEKDLLVIKGLTERLRPTVYKMFVEAKQDLLIADAAKGVTP